MGNYFLETERLCFSKWKIEDLQLASELWGDKDVTLYITASGQFSSSEIKTRLDTEMGNLKKCGVQYWPIFEKTTGKFVGCCGLRPHKPDELIYELGFHLKKEFWGNGFGSEAAEAVIHYAFEQLHAEELIAGHHPDNLSSKKILKRLGFYYIGDKFYPPTKLKHPSYVLKKSKVVH